MGEDPGKDPRSISSESNWLYHDLRQEQWKGTLALAPTLSLALALIMAWLGKRPRASAKLPDGG